MIYLEHGALPFLTCMTGRKNASCAGQMLEFYIEADAAFDLKAS